MISSLRRLCVDVRRIAGQSVEIGERNGPLALWSGHAHDGVERRKRHAHVRRVDGNALFARPENRVDAVEAVDGRAPVPGSRLLHGVAVS